MSYHLVLWNSTTSKTFHSLWALLPMLTTIRGLSSKIWLKNVLLEVKCNFHGWKIDVRSAFFICWGISSLYALLLIFLTIFQDPAFFILSNFVITLASKVPYIYIYYITNFVAWVRLAVLINPVYLFLLYSCKLIL